MYIMLKPLVLRQAVDESSKRTDAYEEGFEFQANFG